MMRLIGGPLNNVIIEDSGTFIQKMSIYSELDSMGNPVIGCKMGYAIYEPNEERTHSFWLDNEWQGILEQIVIPDDDMILPPEI